MSTKNSELHNFADDNTIISSSDTLSQLIQDLQSEANKATDWFDLNNMIIKPEKFQAIIIDKKGQNNNPTEINIDREKNHFWKKYSILGLGIDIKLNFDKHISKLHSKSAGQLNALNRLNRYLGFEGKQVLINSFIHGNFSYSPFVCHFCSKNSLNKIKKIKKGL